MLSFWNSTICTKNLRDPPPRGGRPSWWGVAPLVVGGCVYVWSITSEYLFLPPPQKKKKYTHSHSIGNKNQSGCILMLYKFIAGSLGWAINTVVPFSLTGIISNFISHLPILYLFNFQLFAWLPRNTPWIMKIAADFSLTIGNFLAISEHLAFF